MIIDELISFSNRCGADKELVLAGGGNTSAKDGGYMFVKGSGTSLATITAEGFVKIDLDKLSVIYTKEYSDNDSEREAQVLSDLMASRCEGSENRRPSVETTLHALFEQRFVLHLHPALVNGLTCSIGGESAAKDVIDRDFIWVDACKPGYVLAMLCRQKMDEFKKISGKAADMIILQNHGIFFAADSVEELYEMLGAVMTALQSKLTRGPDLSANEPKQGLIKLSDTLINGVSGITDCEFITNRDALRLCGSRQSAEVILKPFTPDHIVYCKAYPLFVGREGDISVLTEEYKKQFGFYPRVILCEGEGIICAGENQKQAQTVKLLFEDAIKIAVYTESFGGALHMTDELTDFIVNWEVESYRSSQSK